MSIILSKRLPQLRDVPLLLAAIRSVGVHTYIPTIRPSKIRTMGLWKPLPILERPVVMWHISLLSLRPYTLGVKATVVSVSFIILIGKTPSPSAL